MDFGMTTEEDFARNAENRRDEERVSAFNKNINDGGFLKQRHVGDVIFHNPFMVHASCKNMDPENRIRLATDLRFVNPKKPYDERWMK
ncbi:hypothetical protein INS49_010739 [Diaporthe citri]|uniref:uncharacterized protein n=1 Tax=Diaporthe citri TaxID=83186 RepID=UPI001C7F58A0|nr:uncharacterized protein INS49_010739 [Diaporthe citri]KAG6362507.1 hypothetical protein INS49_010739 [Diaporthe citri]